MAHASHAHDHERTDAHVRPLVNFLIFMTVSVVLSFAFVTVLFQFFSQRVATIYGPPHALSTPGGESGAPQLQVVPGLDLREIRANEAEQLEGYGWVDQREGLVHVPIEEAIDMLMEQGVPARAAASGDE